MTLGVYRRQIKDAYIKVSTAEFGTTTYTATPSEAKWYPYWNLGSLAIAAEYNAMRIYNSSGSYGQGMVYGGYIKAPISANPTEETSFRALFVAKGDGTAPRFGICSGLEVDSDPLSGNMLGAKFAAAFVATYARVSISNDADAHYQVFECADSGDVDRDMNGGPIGSFDPAEWNKYEIRVKLVKASDDGDTDITVLFLINGTIQVMTEDYLTDPARDYYSLLSEEVRPYFQIQAGKKLWLRHCVVVR
jgi:hypothetical protein